MKISRCLHSQIASGTAERLVGDCFFSSPGFADVWRAKGGRPVIWAAQSGDETAAILPGVEFGRSQLCRFIAMPDGCHSGIFFAREVTEDRQRIAQLLLDGIYRRRYLKTHLFDFYGSVPRDPRFDILTCVTTLVDISDPEWQPPDKKLLAQIRKAEREGIQLEPFDWDRHDAKFMKLVHVTKRRHGRGPEYPAAFFKALAELARHDRRIHWIWCEYDGKPVCSHIYFIEGGILQGWQKYFDKAFSFLKPNQYIRFMMCRKMAKLGIPRLNLGTTPDGAIGLAYYKRRWGGSPFHFNCYVLKRGLGRFL